MIPFICITCGSLCIVRETDDVIYIVHPTNLVCASRTNLQNGTLRARRYLQLSAKLEVVGDPTVTIT